jgi:uncharacterized protein (TIGR02118 family)
MVRHWEERMLRCTVIYPNREGARFDFDYYVKKHIPMANEALGGRFEVMRGLPGPDGKPPEILCVATLAVPSPAEFEAREQKHGARLGADIANYTNLTPIIQMTEILT